MTDAIIPGISERVLAECLVQKYSNLKVLFIYGYTDNAIFNHGVLDPQVEFLQKPFSKSDLAAKMCEAISSKFPI